MKELRNSIMKEDMNLYSREDCINNVLDIPIVKRIITINNNKIENPVIFKSQKKLDDYCKKIGFSFYDIEESEDFYSSEEIYYINDEKGAIIEFRKNDMFYNMQKLIYNNKGIEEVIYSENITKVLQDILNDSSIKNDRFIKIPINMLHIIIPELRIFYNRIKTSFPKGENESKIISELYIDKIKDNGFLLEKNVMLSLVDTFKKHVEKSSEFDNKYCENNNNLLNNQKFHRINVSGDFSYSDTSLIITEIGKTYVKMEEYGDSISMGSFYIVKEDFDKYIENTKNCFKPYMLDILKLIKNIISPEIIECIINDIPLDKNKFNYTSMRYKQGSYECNLGSLTLNCNPKEEYTYLKFNNNREDFYDGEREKNIIQGTPFDTLLAYAETKNNSENIDNITYFSNIYNKLIQLDRILREIMYKTGKIFNNEELEKLKETFNTCYKNIEIVMLETQKSICLLQKE